MSDRFAFFKNISCSLYTERLLTEFKPGNFIEFWKVITSIRSNLSKKAKSTDTLVVDVYFM